MKFELTSLAGVWRIEPDLKEDERGFLLRTYCEAEFGARGLNTRWPQSNLTLTRRRGMIRGMHYQSEPKPEIKLIRCVSGAVWDVIVDIRPDSPTFAKWEAFELSAANCRQLAYQMSEFYIPELARGVRWDDPQIGIPWPIPDPIVSARDRNLPRLSELDRET